MSRVEKIRENQWIINRLNIVEDRTSINKNITISMAIKTKIENDWKILENDWKMIGNYGKEPKSSINGVNTWKSLSISR